MQKVNDIRQILAEKLKNEEFVTDKTGVKTIEIMNAAFIADESAIFGTVNEDYVTRELQWYKSMSLNVNDIPGGPPAIWKSVATPDGYINSNYGWCIYSQENDDQYLNCLAELRRNQDTRRAIMIYTRPGMQWEFNKGGMSDFMCTNTVQYLVRDGKLNALVYMRSNDAWAGYRNDFAWQEHVLASLCEATGIPMGSIYWNVASLHVYEKNFYLIDTYNKGGDHNITKEEYRKLYPDSPWAK